MSEYTAQGRLWNATHNVFPAFTEKGTKVVVKEARPYHEIATRYYVFQSKYDFGRRLYCSAEDGLTEEKRKLEVLEGLNVPRFVELEGRILVRSYIEGLGFRYLDSQLALENCVVGAIEELQRIHNHGVIHGNAHARNVVWNYDDGKIYWVGFSGKFSEQRSIKRRRAYDLAKLIFSTWTEKRDMALTLFTAEKVNEIYRDQKVLGKLVKEVDKKTESSRLANWFAFRTSIFGTDVAEEIVNKLL